MPTPDDVRLAAFAAYQRGLLDVFEDLLAHMGPDERWAFNRMLETCGVRVLEVHFRLKRQAEQSQETTYVQSSDHA